MSGLSENTKAATDAFWSSATEVMSHWPTGVGFGLMTWLEFTVLPMLPTGGSVGVYNAIQGFGRGLFKTWEFLYYDKYMGRETM